MGTSQPARGFLRRCWHALRADWTGWWAALHPLHPGRRRLLSYPCAAGQPGPHVHLQLGPGGGAVLLIDVQDAVHLNPTAALIVRWLLEGLPHWQIVRLLKRRYRYADEPALHRQVAAVAEMLDRLLEPTARCPTCALQVPRVELFSRRPEVPLKADVCLTYGCNNACSHCYNPPSRRKLRPLGPRQWRRVLKKLARVGIPHVIFTGGEPTLVDDLPELIRFARRLGLVAGLNTNGRRLADKRFAARLARSGLSHVQITLLGHRAELHDELSGVRPSDPSAFQQTVRGIRNALEVGLHTITNTTLTRRNAPWAEKLVDFLHALGVRTFAANSMIHSGRGRNHPDALSEEELGPVLVSLRDRAVECHMRFLWYTPTQYCRLSPLELELGARRCNAAEYSICIEPNGDVLPCQSYYRPAGNLLRDPWPRIWHSPLFQSFRRRVDDPAGCGLPEKCHHCPELSICAGGCRLELERRAEVSGKDAAFVSSGANTFIERPEVAPATSRSPASPAGPTACSEETRGRKGKVNVSLG